MRQVGDEGRRVGFLGGDFQIGIGGVCFRIEKILANEKILAVIPAHLYYQTADERLEIIMDKMKKILDMT